MSRSERHPLISGARITSLGTLASRVLGMLRDMATAALLGLAGGGAMDALVIAYRIPNLFRRLFGEGALTASYLPVFSAELERDRRAAWQLASVALLWLAVLLGILVIAGEGVCALVWIFWGGVPGVTLLVGLSAVMLPYLWMICLAAQISATLHALSHFTVPSLVPIVLNLCWLSAAGIAWLWIPDEQGRAYALALAVVVAGFLQLGVQVPVLRRYGFRFDYCWKSAREGISRISRAMVPMLAGLAVTQVNTFLDSLIAWGFAASADGPRQIAWLAGAVEYPLEQGAAAAIYYGERLYHFPLGVLGVAVATAIFPLLSRHAARGDHQRLGQDLTLGLRLVIFLGIPAGVGLIVLAEPLARLLFERGRFTPEDTLRTARMIRCYALGVWAFCAMPVVVRGFYALSDWGTPARLAAWMVGLNLSLNLALIWTPLEEAGLAVATSISAAVQVFVLIALFSRRKSPLVWRELGSTLARTLLATLSMALVGMVTLGWLVPNGTGIGNELARVFLPLALCVGAYLSISQLSRGNELRILLGRDHAT